ncbi:hypothetical protein [Actinophytocola sp. KF-1]
MSFWDNLPFGGMTGAQIYHNFRGGTGDDGFGLSASAFYVEAIVKNYEERTKSITKLTTRMESAWEGEGGGAARRGAGPLAVEHGLAKDSMMTAHTTMHDQFDAFRVAQRTVTEVPPTPDKPSAWDNLTSLGGAGRDYESQMTQVSAANEQNVAVMTAYEGVSAANVERMPTSYGRITDDYAAVGVERPPPPTPPPGYVPPPKTGRYPTGSTPGTGSDTGTNQNGSSDSFTQVNPQHNNPTNPQHNNPTYPSEIRPPSTVEPPRGPLPPGQNPGQNPNHPGLPGMMPPAFGPNGGGGGTGGGRGFGPGGGRGFGPGGGPGGPGAGGSGAGGPGAGGRGGMGSGFGPGGAAAAAEGAGARGGIGGPGGAGGRGGMGGGMGGGGRRGEGEDDAEHERPSFLVEPDPHDTFGTDEVTAPPVIGE